MKAGQKPVNLADAIRRALEELVDVARRREVEDARVARAARLRAAATDATVPDRVRRARTGR